MQVPFIDLTRQYLTIKKEIDQAIHDTIKSCAFVAGEKVKEFENNFAKYCGVKHAIGISSGTSALYVGLKVLGVKKGDAVLTTPFTFIATAEAITLNGARPIFIDIDENSYNISLSALEVYLKKSCTWDAKTKSLRDKKNHLRISAILPVHLYGQIADMDEIMNIARKYNLSVIEDAAQAHGATYKNKKAGSIGDIGIFSFYPTKNLSAYGQGGAAITNDAKLAETMRLFIDHGQKKKYTYAFEGWNFKMDGLQAAILNVKLRYLDTWNGLRRIHANTYLRMLKNVDGLTLPKESPHCQHVYHVYVLRTKQRDALHAHLKDLGVNSLLYYPIPLHLQQAYKYLGYRKGDFPIAEKCAREVLSLPIFPELREEELKHVGRSIKNWFKQKP